MRYPVAKIKEALLSQDSMSRIKALEYFTESYSEDPEIMRLIFQAIDRYDCHELWLSGFAHLKQTDESIQGIVKLIEQGPTESMDRFSLRQLIHSLEVIDIRLIEPYLDRIFHCASVKSDTREILKSRLEMSRWDEDRCWSSLEKCIVDLLGKDEVEWFPRQPSAIIVEAIAQAGCRQTDRIIEALKRHIDVDEKVHEFNEMILPSYISLAGLLKMKEAVPFLVHFLGGENELLQSVSANALIRIGTPEIVSLIAPWYESGNDETCIQVVEVMQAIKCDESIFEISRLLGTQTDPDRVEHLLFALIMQFDPDRIPLIYNRLITDQFNPMRYDIYPCLLHVSDLLGVQFDGYDNLEAIVSRQRKEEFILLQKHEMELHKKLAAERRNRESVETMPRSISESTIINDSDRVGRNDPCPCGSGKKFKKCCINKAGA